MDDTYKYGEGQSLELMHNQVNTHENGANKCVPKIRKKRKRQQQRVMYNGQMKNCVRSLHRKRRIHWEDTIFKEFMV
jgi:hypothetical protein